MDRPSSFLPSRETIHNGDPPVGGYEALAAEYYDRLRHPTCANFRDGSRQLLSERLSDLRAENLLICELGAGKSLLAEILAPRLASLDHLVLVDSSPSMLAFSNDPAAIGARLLLADATKVPIRSGSVDVIVSSLGDPYNTEDLWSEARRLLRPGGRVFFTTPSYEWARAFRTNPEDDLKVAEFELADGQRVLVPSYILPVDEQIAMMTRHGLRFDNVDELRLSALRSLPISPKLLRDGQNLVVVTCFSLTLPDQP